MRGLIKAMRSFVKVDIVSHVSLKTTDAHRCTQIN